MRNIGAINALYPTPVAIIGTEIDGRINWINIVHVGIMGRSDIMLSMGKSHYSTRGIRENKTCSVNLVDQGMLERADYVGIVSGEEVDKSKVFEYFRGSLEGAPLISEAPVAMECELIDIYETETHDNFILRPVNTFVKRNMLTENYTIDYKKAKPILFEMPNRRYIGVDGAMQNAWELGEKYRDKI